jgi:hypothetical protein
MEDQRNPDGADACSDTRQKIPTLQLDTLYHRVYRPPIPS